MLFDLENGKNIQRLVIMWETLLFYMLYGNILIKLLYREL